MPDGAIVLPDTASAPKDYTLAGTQEIQLKSVRAVIDGSGAGSAFLPTLQLLDPNGHVCWEGATLSTVAAGGSADVSWFQGLGAALAGIRYDVCNVGDWLAVKATSSGGTCGDDPSEDNWGIVLISDGNGGLALFDGLESNPAVGGGIQLTEYGAGGVSLNDGQPGHASGGLTLGEQGNGGIRLVNSGTGIVQIEDEGSPAGGIQFTSDNSIQLSAPAIFLQGLPLADPHVNEQLWNNAGVVTISAG